mgnify:CR=1 FL=1
MPGVEIDSTAINEMEIWPVIWPALYFSLKLLKSVLMIH